MSDNGEVQKQIVVGREGLSFVDEQGRAFARLTRTEDGGAFALLDGAGREAVIVEATPAGGRLTVGKNGLIHATIQSEQYGGAVGVCSRHHLHPPVEGFPTTPVCVGGLSARPGGGQMFVANHEGGAVAEMCVHEGDGTLGVFTREAALTFGVPTWKFLNREALRAASEQPDGVSPTT